MTSDNEYEVDTTALWGFTIAACGFTIILGIATLVQWFQH